VEPILNGKEVAELNKALKTIANLSNKVMSISVDFDFKNPQRSIAEIIWNLFQMGKINFCLNDWFKELQEEVVKILSVEVGMQNLHQILGISRSQLYEILHQARKRQKKEK